MSNILYHVWGKTLTGKEKQIDTTKQPRIGYPIKIGSSICKVVDYAEYELKGRQIVKL